MARQLTPVLPLHSHLPSEKQTVAFNIAARVNFKTRRRARMGVWEAMEMLNTLVDESDPDVCRNMFPVRYPLNATR